MPYRIDLPNPSDATVNALIDLGALDVETTAAGLAALLPDALSVNDVAAALGLSDLRASSVPGHDDGSVWTLSRRPVRTRLLLVVPSTTPEPGAILIADGPVFGTGLHATTALCLTLLEDLLEAAPVTRLLDVGTGSGILAIAALRLGVPRVVGIEIDAGGIEAAATNAQLNHVRDRLSVVRGGPEALRGAWPLVVANIRAAELMALAPLLVRRVATRGRLLLSGIPHGVAADVERTYRRMGMALDRSETRDGWTALVLRASW